MSIGINQPIPKECTAVKAGTIFRLFTTTCDNWNLRRFIADDPARRHIPHAADKAMWEGVEADHRIKVCGGPFSKKGFMLRAKVQRRGVAPFNWNLVSQYTQTVTFPGNTSDYNEQNGVVGDGDTSLSITSFAGTVPDILSSGSSGSGSARFAGTFTYDDSNPCNALVIDIVANLLNLGAETDSSSGYGVGFIVFNVPSPFYRGGVRTESGIYLAGTPDPQRFQMNVPMTGPFRISQGGFWTGAHWFRLAGVPDEVYIAIVMNLTYQLTFSR